MLMAVLLIFVLCWTPIYLLEFSQGIRMMLDKFGTISDYKLDIKLWLMFLFQVNSCANFFIYYLASE